MTMQLTDADMRDAVRDWLEKQGFKVTGEVTLAHTPAGNDSGGFTSESFTASAPVEKVTRKRKDEAAK